MEKHALTGKQTRHDSLKHKKRHENSNIDLDMQTKPNKHHDDKTFMEIDMDY